MSRLRYGKLAASLAAPFVAGCIGSLATTPNIESWYSYLDKPPFNPPSWVFGPVWTLLYILMGIALYIVWIKRSKLPKQSAFVWFGVQLVFNTLWSVVFFRLHAPWAAVGIIIALIISIAMTIRQFWKFSRPAAYLLLPYLAWVLFATCLNVAIAVLN